MPRILIITTGPLCENPRPLKEALTLSDAGYDVTTLTVRHSQQTEQKDLELVARGRFSRVVLDIAPGFQTPAQIVWSRRLRTKVARIAALRLGIQSAASLGPSHALLRAARRIPADMVIVHNEAAHWVGTRLLKEGRRVAADIEDWHSEDLRPEDRKGRPLALLRSSERTLLQAAAYCSTTSHALAAALRAAYGGRPPTVITNSFPLYANPHRYDGTSVPSLFWFSQTVGPGRGLEPFVAAWAATRVPSRLTLLGDVRDGFRSHLLASVPVHRRNDVTFTPTVPPSILPDVIAQHDLGLALEDPSIRNRDLTITNKILQYLNAGLPVLATGTAGQREVLSHSPGAGWLVDIANAPQLAEQLDCWLANRTALVRMGEAARRAAEQTYCWEIETPKLLSAVGAALRQEPERGNA